MTKNKRVLKLTKRALIIFIVALTVLGTVACSPPPIQSGILEEDYVIDIEGNITFTISNESGTAAEAAAPKAIASAFMKKYPDVTVEVEKQTEIHMLQEFQPEKSAMYFGATRMMPITTRKTTMLL